MKKLSLLFTLFFLCSMTVFAGKGITVTHGEKKFMKKTYGTAFLEIKWENAMYDNKEPLVEKIDSLDELKPIAYESFVKDFNENSKNIEIIGEKSKADWIFILEVSSLDRFVNVMKFVPCFVVEFTGTLDVMNARTGNKVLSVSMEDVSSPITDYSITVTWKLGIIDVFEYIGKKISKL